MLNLKELIDVGCAQTMVDSDGQIYPCSKPIVAIRHWPDYGDGESYSGVCQQHAKQAGADLIPLKNVPNPLLLPVAVLNTQLYAKPEDDIEDGQYVSLFQLYLDGFELSRTGRK